MWHYKCIRPILNGHTWPNFLCPNCRAVADLEADPDEEVDEEEWQEDDGVAEAIEEESRRSGEADAGSSRGGVVQGEEGLRTPRAMQPVVVRVDAEGNGDDGDVGALAMQALSLTETITRSDPSPLASDHPSEVYTDDNEDDEHPTQVEESTPARNIPRNASGGHGDAIRQYELTAGNLNTEPVMTPRNDIGPFVLDGGADRNSTGGSTAQASQRSLDAAAAAATSS